MDKCQRNNTKSSNSKSLRRSRAPKVCLSSILVGGVALDAVVAVQKRVVLGAPLETALGPLRRATCGRCVFRVCVFCCVVFLRRAACGRCVYRCLRLYPFRSLSRSVSIAVSVAVSVFVAVFFAVSVPCCSFATLKCL